MGNRVYVGNLPFSVRDESLAQLFAEVGEVTRASVVTDTSGTRSRGFGFVEMASDALAASAVERFNGREVSGRALKVDLARPRPERSRNAPRRESPRQSPTL